VDDVLAATRERLAKVVVGAPGTEGVTMGALASLDQREEALRSLKALLGVAQLVVGDPDHFPVVGADRDRGAFLPPMLCAVTMSPPPSRTTSKHSVRSVPYCPTKAWPRQ
jgi:oxepin-CoA hydrolase / 3-oxo-5,6-dehydrosuberyl-CoA semialdehyde dehydrogenase